MQSELYPSPHFEGVEKRIEINFRVAADDNNKTTGESIPVAGGLRCLSRAALDVCMTAAECEIVSVRSNEKFDAYVLSESSLFVFADKIVLKTCGTTKLLSAVDPILERAALIERMKLVPSSVRFTRSTYLFPEEQREHHVSFADECEFLESRFGHLGSNSSYVMGSNFDDAQWHVYVAGDFVDQTKSGASLSVECCMTSLHREHSQHFFREDSQEEGVTAVPFVSSEKTTNDSGIQSIFETFSIDDYVFEPCGYSMNGLNEEFSGEYSTIHITPEDGFSYASVEHSNVDLNSNSAFSVSNFVEKCANVFQPGKMTFAVTCHGGRETTNAFFSSLTSTKKELFCVGESYARPSMCFQQLPNDQGFVAYLTFVKTEEDERERLSAKVVVPETRGKVAQEDHRSETPMCILDAAMSSGESSETDDSLRESTDEYVSYNHGDEEARLQRSAAGMV
jgi:S-adenosylmethionine decarboxylase proenzyme